MANDSTRQDWVSMAAALNDYLRVAKEQDIDGLLRRIDWFSEMNVALTGIEQVMKTDPALANSYCWKFGVDLTVAEAPLSEGESKMELIGRLHVDKIDSFERRHKLITIIADWLAAEVLEANGSEYPRRTINAVGALVDVIFDLEQEQAAFDAQIDAADSTEVADDAKGRP